jgi:hypothetical protein
LRHTVDTLPTHWNRAEYVAALASDVLLPYY